MIDILVGDWIDQLRALPDESVQCAVTSPPYYGLRDYGTATWEGGDEACDHVMGLDRPRSERPLGKFHGGNDAFHVTPYRDICGKCGAVRIDDQLGLEPTPAEYVAKMVAGFREVRRVLRNDGVVWLNLGDSYAANRGYQVPDGKWTDVGNSRGMKAADYGLKPKDLIGIPWRVAFALQDDGWWLRSDCIWHKPNPMPESVTDRPTKSHEYVFLLSKSARYFYDAEAVKEEASNAGKEVSLGDKSFSKRQAAGARVTPSGNGLADTYTVKPTRNRRSVWTIATQPYSGAHFAVMPPDLAEVCIKAGSAEGDTVLDPFGGAGTTGLVADRLGRNAILIELNPDYAAQARDRIRGDNPMFTQVEVR